MRHHVDVPGFLPRLVGRLGPAHAPGHARVGDEDVDRPVGLGRLRDQRLHAALARGVELHREAAELAGDRLGRREVTIGDDDRARALLRQAPRERSADPPAAARDDDVPPRELHLRTLWE